ncbi:hypothetical protein AgCh_007940 [Apium graveolens]
MVIRRWKRPVTGWLKVNIDAALFEDVHSIGLCVIVRDAKGKFLMITVRQRDDLGSANEVAHALARATRSMLGFPEWYDCAPEFIDHVIVFEGF